MPSSVRRRGRAAARAVVAAARALEADGLVVGTVGNVSARVGDALLITPTRTAYGPMRPGDLARVDVATGAASGAPSRELPLHLEVYRSRPDVGAVLHSHSLAATAWSFLDEPLGPELEDLPYHGIAPVRTAAPAAPGSRELAAGAVRALGGGSAVLLGRHGVLTVGTTPADALTAARVVERQAQVAWLLRGAAPWVLGPTASAAAAAWTPPAPGAGAGLETPQPPEAAGRQVPVEPAAAAGEAAPARG